MATVQLRPEIERRLEFVSALSGRTKSDIIRDLIARSIDEVEERYLGRDRDLGPNLKTLDPS